MKGTDNRLGKGLSAKAKRLGFQNAVEREPSERNSKYVKGTDKRTLCSALEKNKDAFANVFQLREYWRDDELHAALKGNCVELCFADYANARDPAKALNKGRSFARKLVKKRIDYRLTSGATDEYALRSPRDLVAFGILLGLTREQSIRALRPLGDAE
ncbi:MAG: hypothetical protein WC607_01890 [Candidatus Micrarchaeia archaeon]